MRGGFLRELNQNGVTLVEMLIASAILGILALALTMLFTQQSHQQSNLQLQATFDSLLSSVQSQVPNPAVILHSSKKTESQTNVPQE